MSEPLSWQVLEALENRFELVLVANGWHSDIGASVRLDDEPIGDSDAPCVALWTTDKSRSSQSTARIQNGAITVVCTGYALSTGTNRDGVRLAHRIASDLERALQDTSTNMPKLPNGVGSLSISAGPITFTSRPEGSRLISVQIVATIGLTERLHAQ